jgi:hypothetical protein
MSDGGCNKERKGSLDKEANLYLPYPQIRCKEIIPLQLPVLEIWHPAQEILGGKGDLYLPYS